MICCAVRHLPPGAYQRRRLMSRIGLLATVCGVAAFALASAVNATPLGAPAKGLSAAETGVVDLVHGCHREWARAPWWGAWDGGECPRYGGRRAGAVLRAAAGL